MNEIPTECLVCNTIGDSSPIINLPCKCSCCSDCLVNWVTTQVKENPYLIKKEIPCLFSNCTTPLNIDQFFYQLSKPQQETINSTLLEVYLTQSSEIQRCPSQGCSFAGLKTQGLSCREPFECGACGTKWKDSTQVTFLEKIHSYFLTRKLFSSDMFSYLWKKRNTKDCPKCSVSIEKNGGCQHMTCQKCGFEFCWQCGREHPLHQPYIHFLKERKSSIFFFTILVILYLSILVGIERVPELRILKLCPLFHGKEVFLVSLADSLICTIFFRKRASRILKNLCKLALLCCLAGIYYWELYVNFFSIAIIQMAVIVVGKYLLYLTKTCCCKRRG